MSAISNGLVINGVTYSLTNGDLAPQVIKLVESKIQSSVIKAIKIIGISFLVLFFYGKLVSVGPTKEPLSNQIPQYHPQVYIGNKAEDISSSEANDENFGLPKAPFTEKAD